LQKIEDVPADDRWLSARELAVLDKLHNPKRNQDWRLGRWTVKRIVAHYLGFEDNLTKIEIIAAEDGAPEVFVNRNPAGVAVSISHSNGVGFCVAAREVSGIGCDIELIEVRSDEFITDYFTADEIALCRNSPPEQLALLSTLIWSAKESVLKVLRAGLRIDTRSIEITLVPQEVLSGWKKFSTRYVADANGFCGAWLIHQNFVLTVAVPSAASLRDAAELLPIFSLHQPM
jgi:4'-phosphopantetheinyl transferase